METTDTITKQFVEGFGIIELPNGEQFQEKIRAMTPEEVKERGDLQIANTTESMRNRVLTNQRHTNNGNIR